VTFVSVVNFTWHVHLFDDLSVIFRYYFKAIYQVFNWPKFVCAWRVKFCTTSCQSTTTDDEATSRLQLCETCNEVVAIHSCLVMDLQITALQFRCPLASAVCLPLLVSEVLF